MRLNHSPLLWLASKRLKFGSLRAKLSRRKGVSRSLPALIKKLTIGKQFAFCILFCLFDFLIFAISRFFLFNYFVSCRPSWREFELGNWFKFCFCLSISFIWLKTESTDHFVYFTFTCRSPFSFLLCSLRDTRSNGKEC